MVIEARPAALRRAAGPISTRKLRVQVRGELRRLQKRLGTTRSTVTHDQDEAMSLSDRIEVMNAGQCEQVGSRRRSMPSREPLRRRLLSGQVNALPGPRDRVRESAARASKCFGRPLRLPSIQARRDSCWSRPPAKRFGSETRHRALRRSSSRTSSTAETASNTGSALADTLLVAVEAALDRRRRVAPGDP
jgi:ABC-type Fe3+/spermidine/putrescine transport system ATPase subunit